MKLNALIVDDELLARKNLSMLLNEYCPAVNVVGEAESTTDAKAIIESARPDVIFLDIRMPSGSEGFELLDSIENPNFLVVFVTAFREYALRAFQANAIHYVLKPIDIEDLKTAVDKVLQAKSIFSEHPENFETYVESIKHLSEGVEHQGYGSTTAISHTKGIKLVQNEDIVYLEASGNCTVLYFKDETRYLDTRTLKIYEDMLNPQTFYRIHKSHIINLDYLKEYVSEDGHFAVLKNNKALVIARSRVPDFVKTLKAL